MSTTRREMDTADAATEFVADSPISLSHFTHTIDRYRNVIGVTLGIVALAYVILALVLYLVAPMRRVTTQPFRLEFDGASEGRYPNGSRFNVADIVSGPILKRVYDDNHLEDYLKFGEFSRSIYVLESNREYANLSSEYQAKLADPKLSPIDRERLEHEFEMRAESISKGEYSINFVRRHGTKEIPEALAAKVLSDVLGGWADFEVNQQHVITYEVSVVSPDFIVASSDTDNLVSAIVSLRAQARLVVANVMKMEMLPGATLARSSDRLSLQELRLRLDQIQRFQLDPLLATVIHSAGLTSDRASATRFFETQLAYDQRQLDAAQRRADAIRESMAVYEGPVAERPEPGSGSSPSKTMPPAGESIMPQLSDSFLDRLVALSGRSADAKFRQRLVDDYRDAVNETIPMREAVSYDQQFLAETRGATTPSVANASSVRTQIEKTRTELKQLIASMDDLLQAISHNMTPSAQLFTSTAPATQSSLGSVNVLRLVLYGVLLLLVALPVTILACMFHQRVREEEAAAILTPAAH